MFSAKKMDNKFSYKINMQFMKKPIIFFFLVLFCSMVNAQLVQIAEGPVFPDTIPGYSKILQMKNYSTMFFHINFTEGLNVHVYEPKYHAKTETNIEPSYGKLKSGNIEGIFEINSDAVILISNTDENTRSLYRLIIDGTTGKLKDEKLIASRNLIPSKSRNSITTEDLQPQLLVRKDPDSENYAVVMTNIFVTDSSKRIEMILYGSDNKEFKRAYYSSPVEKFKYLRFIDMAVIGKDKVAAFIYGYNLKDNKEKEGDLVLADLGKASEIVAFTELYYSNELNIDRGIIRYDPKIKQLLLLAYAEVQNNSENMNAYLSFIDPSSRKLLTNTIVPGEKIQKKYNEISGSKSGYAGIPQNLFINDNRTCTIVFEEMEWGKKKDIPNTVLKNIAVVTYDYEADPASSYFIPMDQYVSDISLPSFYQYNREKTGQQSFDDNQYKSSVYISDGRNSFVLLNDSEVNDDATFSSKFIRFTDTKNANAYLYQLNDKITVPKRVYVFGKSADKNEHRSAVFNVYDYDKENGLLVTLKAEKEGPHPGVKLVWLQL